jgi:hypothetical protein
MRIFLPILLLGISFSAWCQSMTSQPPFSLNLSAAADNVTAGSDVHVKIEMKDVSNHDVDCTGAPSNGLDRAYQYEVRDDRGRLVPKIVKKHPEIGETFSTWPCRLKPGETATAAGGLISRLYDMSRPGQYTIQVSRSISDNPKDGVVKSNKITITVTEPISGPAQAPLERRRL